MTRNEHSRRLNRKSLSCKLGKLARQIKARSMGMCFYCGKSASETGMHMHLDHVVPRALGGEDKASNLIVACHSCNSIRRDMPIPVWSEYAARHLGIFFTPESVFVHVSTELTPM